MQKNKFGFQWTEATKNYGELINSNLTTDCLVYDNSSVIASNCDANHHSFCVHRAEECRESPKISHENSSLKLLTDVSNSSRLFLVIEYEEHLKMLGQHPFKCFVDLNVSEGRLLYKPETLSFGEKENVSLYGFPALDFISSSYWCEAFRKYDLELVRSNKLFSTCQDHNSSLEVSAANYTSPWAIVSSLSKRNTQVTKKHQQKVCFFLDNRLRGKAKLAPICITLHSTSNVTAQLTEILNSSLSAQTCAKQLYEISTNYLSFLPIDVYLSALIFRKFSDCNIDVSLATCIVHNIMEIDREVLKDSQRSYNATSILLFRFDKILANAEMADATDYVQVQKGGIMSLIANLKNANFSGAASYNHSNNMSFVVLSKETSLQQVLNDPNLHSAIILPEMSREEEESKNLALTFYSKDSLFNVDDSSRIKEVSSIFGTRLNGFKGTLDSPIYVVFRRSATTNQTCAYWKMFPNTLLFRGRWVVKDYGVTSNDTNFVICKYYNLAHFALLIFEDVYVSLEDSVIRILEVITVVNSALSLFGASGIILTAVLFKNWRRNKGNLVLMNFVIAITLQVVSLHVSNYVDNHYSNGACSLVGAILHYSVLSEFCWMLLIAVLQYKRYVQVFAGPPEHLMTKACVVGWILPLIPVALLLIVQPHNYTKSLVGLCYPSAMALYLTIFIPVGVILVVNIIIYVLIIVDIFSARKRCMKRELIFQWLIVVLLFFMLGVTWAFAFLSCFFKSTILAFIFCVTSSLQGFVIFLFFVVFNKKTRKMYVRCFQKYLNRNVISSKTNTTERY